MLIRLRDLEIRAIPFQVEVPAGQIDYSTSLVQSSDLRAEGKAELLSSSLGEIRIQGRLAVRVDAGCDRCLEKAAVAVDNAFDLVYLPAKEARVGSGEDEVEESALEVGYYEGDSIELNDVFREVVLLALPMQVFCQEDCKGICPVCGQNRNTTDCQCALPTTDDRWSKLKAFKAELTPGD